MSLHKTDKQYRVIDSAGRFYTVNERFDNYIHYYGIKFSFADAQAIARKYKAEVVKI